MSFCTEIKKYQWLCTILLATLLNSSLNASEIFDGKFGVVGVHIGEKLPEGVFPEDDTSIPSYSSIRMGGGINYKGLGNNTHTSSRQGGGMKRFDFKEWESWSSEFLSNKLFMYSYENNSTKILIYTTLKTKVVAEIDVHTNFIGTETYEECKNRAKSYALNFAKDEKYIKAKEISNSYESCYYSYNIHGNNDEVANFTCFAQPKQSINMFKFLDKKSPCTNTESSFVSIHFTSKKLDKQYVDEIHEAISLEVERRKTDDETKVKTNNDSINKIFQ